MLHRPLLALAVLGGLAATARADGGDPKVEFEKYTLPNGLTVILAPDPSQPLVAVNVWYHVGSGNEVVGRTGFAHLFEHMMFQGSKNVGNDRHFEILRKIGSNEINGTTNADRTNYFEVVPSNQLEVGLWLESDRMSHLLDVLERSELDNQIDVVRNERRQSYDNRPYGKALFATMAALYPEGHPYRYLTIGKHEDLVAASVDDVKSFYKTWYVPANATLALVGDFDMAQAKQLVAKWFGSFPKSAKPALVKVAAPVVEAKEVTVEDPLARLAQIDFEWHSPAKYAEGDAELDVVASALDREGVGRLYKSLVYDKQLAQSVHCSQDGATFSGTFEIEVSVRSGADIAQIKQIIADELARLAKDSVTEKDIARVVAQRESRSFTRLESLNNRANMLQEYDQFLGDPGKLTWDLDRFRTTTPDKVRAAITRYLQPAHMITVITKPTAPDGSGEHHGHRHEHNHDAPAGGNK